MAINTDVIRGAGVALEQEAYKQFGNAVENQADGMLANVLGQKKPASYGINGHGVDMSEYAIWSPTKYAAGVIDTYYPKNKFLFRVKLEFNDKVKKKLANLGLDSNSINDLTYTVKSIDLPTISFDYEDIDMYGFKTKVLKGITHQDLQLSLYDDTANIAMSTVMGYLRLLSPITRNSYRTSVNPSFFEDGAMNFADHSSTSVFAKDKTASREALPNNAIDPLAYLVIEQYFAPSVGQNSPPLKSNAFTFTNPKITRFDISDQNYEDGGTGNTITIAFNYDSIGLQVIENINRIEGTAIGEGNPKGDILNGLGDREFSSDFGPVNRMQAGKTKNPFVEIIHNQGRRAVDNAVRSVLNKTLGPVAGGALGGVISKVGGAAGEMASRTLKGASENVMQNIAMPSSSQVSDNAK